MKKEVIVLTASSLLIGSLGFVGAQSTQSGGAQTQSQTQAAAQTQPSHSFGHGFGDRFGYRFGHGFGDRFGDGFGENFGGGFGGLPFARHLALGTTVTLEFYDTDPGATSGGTRTPTQTLNFTYGQDSEAAFAHSFAEARANAGYVVVNVGEQTQTLELPSTDPTMAGDRRGVYHALPRGLNEGSVTATFYDGDPAANAQTLQTLNFTYGQDSEAGFAADFAEAAEQAAYVTITTSPQTYAVNLAQTQTGRGNGEHGDFRGQGDHRGGPGGDR